MHFTCLQDFEEEARRRMDSANWGFLKSGADQEDTLRENIEAFKRWYIIPRMLKNVSIRSLKTQVLGQEVQTPIGIAPVGLQRTAHPEGECATIRGASMFNTIYIHSTVASSSLEEVSSAAPHCRRWFQIYIFKDRTITEEMIRRAEVTGFSGLVFTVDVPRMGKRLANERNSFSLPPHIKLKNFEEIHVESSQVGQSEDKSTLTSYVNLNYDSSIDWSCIQWIKSISHLPVIVKGLLCAEDAVLAVEHGAAAVIVSNHGGRQLNGVPPSIEVLPEVVKAVNGRCEVYFDGGVRQGTDVLKALALGARMVFVGRPIMWGLCCDGANGVNQVLEILKNELDLNMALAGCKTIDDIKPSLLQRNTFRNKL